MPREAGHRQLNESNLQNEMTFRSGVKLRLHPASLVPFEFFCFRDDVMVQEMDAFLKVSSGRKALLDVGALHGAFSIPFALGASDRRVVAIDPSPIAFAHLLYNVHANELSSVIPLELALSDVAGSLDMHYEWQHLVAAGTANNANEPFLRVRKRPGDEVCLELNFRPDMIKVDVEGHEVRVLRGLCHTIAACRPVIFLEVHPSRIALGGDDAADITRQFSPLNYAACRIDGTAVPLDAISSFTKDERLILAPPTP